MPNALLVYPEYPPSYWGANFAVEMLGRRAAFPPLGLLTVAAMFPPGYDLRVVDMNVVPLETLDLEWADVVFASGTIAQRASLTTVVDACNRVGVRVVVGGPYPTSFHEEIAGVDHFVLDEVEETFAGFLRDLERGSAGAVYRAPRKPDLSRSPIPRFDLVDVNDYHVMCLQYSRGCPFDCEFCDITKLYGRVTRTKSPDQMVAEFESLYRLGWRGQVFLADDNFIGNRREASRLLPVIARWQEARGYPFTLLTEATVNLSRMDKLMDDMVRAGFDSVFLGIETATPKALVKTKKPQNLDRRDENYLFNSVRKIQRKGMQVLGGFILGLDGDEDDVFDAQIELIHDAGIPMALVGLLTVLKGTDLYFRMKAENRLLDVSIGTEATALNYEPELDPETLVEGYLRVTAAIYDPTLESYFNRCLTMFEHLKPTPHLTRGRSRNALYADMMGLRGRLSSIQVPAYLKFIANVSKDYPRFLPLAIRLAALGHHFEKITRQQAMIHDLKVFLSSELKALGETTSRSPYRTREGRDRRQESLERVQSRCEAIPKEFRYAGDGVEDALESFRSAVHALSDTRSRAAAV